MSILIYIQHLSERMTIDWNKRYKQVLSTPFANQPYNPAGLPGVG